MRLLIWDSDRAYTQPINTISRRSLEDIKGYHGNAISSYPRGLEMSAVLIGRVLVVGKVGMR